ncbi:hypothetical protein J7L48_10730 [bacterium]|nr:hypothetical protein [bacterium]
MIKYYHEEKDNFYPLSLSREIEDMYYGAFTNRERLNKFVETRKELTDIDMEINSRFKGFSALKEIFSYGVNVKLVDEKDMFIAKIGSGEKEVTLKKDILFNYVFDMMAKNSEFLKEDISFLTEKELHISNGVIIEDGVFFDTKTGPVFIGENAHIQANSRIQGPCYIGKNAIILSAKVREGCSIFDFVRIGGEVEESIFYPYSNKYHEGFVGHSIFGSFTNLGALTTTSDLKNNYGEIKMFLNGKFIETGTIKLGTLCGDHSKLGIGTLLNSGTVIGFSSNLYGGGFFKKEYNSFYWGNNVKGQFYQLDKAEETAKVVMKRRNIEFTKEDASTFQKIYMQTLEEQ